MIEYLTLPLAALPFPDIDPVIVRIGPLAIHWYGVAYVVGILFAWWYAKRLVTNPRLWPDGVKPMKPEDLDDFLVWAAIGVVLGGRVGYILFYDFARYLANPLDIFAVWQGGMSFHGGFARHHARHDPVCPLARHQQSGPCSMSSRPACRSRSALCGSPISSTPSFGASPPTCPGRSNSRMADRSPRHPSQLYEAALEGLVLFLVLRLLTHSFLKLKTPGFVAGAFVAGYGLSRIFVEFFREPDQQLGYLFGGWLTMGMVLSTPMVLAGIWAMWRARLAG